MLFRFFFPMNIPTLNKIDIHLILTGVSLLAPVAKGAKSCLLAITVSGMSQEALNGREVTRRFEWQVT